MSKLALLALLCLNHIPNGMTLRCYTCDGEKQVIVDGKHYCNAVFDIEHNVVRYGGSDTWPTRMDDFRFGGTKECVLRTGKTRSNPPDVFHFWHCTCFSDLCNHPFTFEQFRSKGYNLRDVEKI
ncbi:hypothetical protein GCK72_026022 [Caenorhabditis remanei]|uniref:Protein sleepless n=1 Tax=Caenorhabditis remanei TaxID=31234 RepID=A0A6A5G4P3_CAERE|nr:hypothetical protein GCK72_026022 [Caenorhabditis remanei]KAF1749554.1 hypothetical protein GCK72_026022 [Caenorhabditis remanei]